MAADDHNPSRRALLGAAVGVPFLGAAGVEEAPPPGSARSPSPAKAGEEWSKALADFRSARAEVLAAERATAGRSAVAEEAWLPVYEARLDALGGAVRAVMLTGAPEGSGLGLALIGWPGAAFGLATAWLVGRRVALWREGRSVRPPLWASFVALLVLGWGLGSVLVSALLGAIEAAAG